MSRTLADVTQKLEQQRTKLGDLGRRLMDPRSFEGFEAQLSRSKTQLEALIAGVRHGRRSQDPELLLALELLRKNS